MKKVILLIFVVISLLLLKTNNNYIKIPEESIRFRIISNSNTAEDLLIKEILLSTLVSEINNITESNNIEESRDTILNSINTIENKLTDKLIELNKTETLKINYGTNYFPKKIFKGVEYPEGYYESLVVEIGKGEGDNFWCVLFPPLCMLENSDKEEVEYKFFVKEIIDKVFK